MAKAKKTNKSNGSNNTVFLVLIGVLVTCFVVIGLLFYKYFYAGSGSSNYGERLIDIDKYPLSATLEDDIKSLYTNEKNISKVKVNVKGRVIYIDMVFNAATKASDAESLASKALDKIGTDNLTYYEVQYLLTYDGEGTVSNFPIFGSKGCSSLKISWVVSKNEAK